MAKHNLYMSSADISALQAEFDSHYHRYQADLWKDMEKQLLYKPVYYGSYGWSKWSEKENKKMENKITEWCVRSEHGGAPLFWRTNRTAAIQEAEAQAAKHPGTKYFVCRVTPETMSVTNSVTTKDL